MSENRATTLAERAMLLAGVRDYLALPGEPDTRLNPKWLAKRLGLDERELLSALAYGVREGLVEMNWEVHCDCGQRPGEYGSLKEAHARIKCAACERSFDLHLDENVRVTFSASNRARREHGEGNEPQLLEDESEAPTRGLDLLLIPAFWELFAGEAPAPDESLRIGRVALLFTDLRGSTAMYAERGDPLAYRLVRDHFAIVGEAIDSNRGALVKTIGDAVMATFASGTDAVRAAFEAQEELHARAEHMGGELIVKAGVHAGACLGVTLNDRLDFFGGAVNTAARVQGLSHGDDVVVTDAVLAEIEAETAQGKSSYTVVESFDAELRGLPEPIRVHRLLAGSSQL